MSGTTETPRHDALDGVRAAAMLLGVVYHSMLFRMFLGGPPPVPPGVGGGGAERYLQDWLHGFRMPLFFLISGFFGRMMLAKYGPAAYFGKRWVRIGVPLVVGMFTFGPAYVLTREALSAGPGFGGAPPRAGASRPGVGEMPPTGFVPPPLARFDEDGDGSLSADEWKKARAELEKAFGTGGPGPPGGGFPGPGGGPFGVSGGLSGRLFGASARLFHLNHLWFLWYLLVFITVAPPVATALAWVFVRPFPGVADRLGSRLIRSGFAPVVLGLVGAPALMITPSMFGWSLGLPASIFRGFPDFLTHLDPDMAYFFLFFLAGWWLHRERRCLPALARAWLPDLLLGVIAFAAATWLGDSYRGRTAAPYYAWVRWGGYSLYGLASASTGFAFLGFFQRYLDRPTPSGRYLADTALWVYLVHQPFVIVGLYLLVPFRLPWWALTGAVSAFSVAACLLLYEAVVRPTFLVRLFGPAASRRGRPLVNAEGS